MQDGSIVNVANYQYVNIMRYARGKKEENIEHFISCFKATRHTFVEGKIHIVNAGAANHSEEKESLDKQINLGTITFRWSKSMQ